MTLMTHHPQSLVLWDVDHTLIENGGVSKENYALAFEILTGRAPEVQPSTDGRTDIGIMENLLTANNVNSGTISLEQQFAALAEAAERNRARLAERGHALPGAVECLTRLSTIPDVIQSVLTGNIEVNARVKLGAFGLDRWLDFSVGGFGADHKIRGMLVPAAQQRATRKYGFDAKNDPTILVGDTKLDVLAALVGGGRVIAVATGVDTADELADAGADAVLEGLADVDAFYTALDAVRAMGAIGPRTQAPSE
jgi:phosphoglycolate phosphatase-like HAD superfamily hydrolase